MDANETIGGHTPPLFVVSSPQRQRAPTITLDTSADNVVDVPAQIQNSPSELRAANSFDSKESRPTSPHNVSNPTTNWGNSQNFLSVPGARSRGNSLDSPTKIGESASIGTYFSSSQGETLHGEYAHDNVFNDKDALRPDPGTEADFEVENNPFAFSPGQLNKLLNPKSLSAFHALGGIAGIERGLRTDRKSGLDVDEDEICRTISFDEAIGASKSTQGASVYPKETPPWPGEAAFADRKRVFSDNRLPDRKPTSLLQLLWAAYKDKVLILFTCAAIISLAVGLHSLHCGLPDVLLIAGVFIVGGGVGKTWPKERQFAKLSKRKVDERVAKVVRSGKPSLISIVDILVGDVLMLEAGDIIPVDGIFIDGHGVKCDECYVTGESDLLKKTPADYVYRAMKEHGISRKLDPFIVSGSKVVEGVGTVLVTSTGIHSSFGKIMMSIREDEDPSAEEATLNLQVWISRLILLFVIPLNFALAISAISSITSNLPQGLPNAFSLAWTKGEELLDHEQAIAMVLSLYAGVVLEQLWTWLRATSDFSDISINNDPLEKKMAVVVGAIGSSTEFGSALGGNIKGKAFSFKNQSVKDLLQNSIALNSTAFETERDVFLGSKVETALLQFARKHLGLGDLNAARSNANIVQMLPFDSRRKVMAVVSQEGSSYRLYVKGDANTILDQCSNTIDEASQGLTTAPLSSNQKSQFKQRNLDYSSNGLTPIAFACKDFPNWPIGDFEHEMYIYGDELYTHFQDMVFVGSMGLKDPTRDSAKEVVPSVALTKGYDACITMEAPNRAPNRMLGSIVRRRFGPKNKRLVGTFFASTLIPNVAAQSTEAPAQPPTWSQRALNALSEILVRCAFLVAPLLISILAGVIASYLRQSGREGPSVFGMFGMALLFATIRTSAGDDIGEDRFILLAVGLAYVLFMLVYCEIAMTRLVLVLNLRRGKGLCSLLVALGVLVAITAMSITPVRAYWLGLTMLDPIFALLVTIPLTFALCDVITHWIHGEVDSEWMLPGPVPGPYGVFAGRSRPDSPQHSLGHSETQEQNLFWRSAYERQNTGFQ